MEDRDALGRFNPGWKGGPGRPRKGESYTDALVEAVTQEELAEMLLAKARDGDMNAIKYLYDRIVGRPVETVNQNVQQGPTRVDLVTHTDRTDTEDSEPMGE